MRVVNNPPKGKLEIIRSAKNKKWYWHLKASNGNLIAQCSEDGFASRAMAIRNFRSVEKYIKADNYITFIKK